VIFDLLHLDGGSLLGRSYDDRRTAVDALASGPQLAVTPSFTEGTGEELLRASVDAAWRGRRKRRSSTYRPGRRSRDWIKVKGERMQEVVIGGYTTGREPPCRLRALLLDCHGRLPEADVRGQGGDRVHGAGEERAAGRPRAARPCHQPVRLALPAALVRQTVWVSPKLVGEVRYGDWTRTAASVIRCGAACGRTSRSGTCAVSADRSVRTKVDGRELTVSNLDKVLYPPPGSPRVRSSTTTRGWPTSCSPICVTGR